jgi:hypothetical protein
VVGVWRLCIDMEVNAAVMSCQRLEVTGLYKVASVISVLLPFLCLSFASLILFCTNAVFLIQVQQPAYHALLFQVKFLDLRLHS